MCVLVDKANKGQTRRRSLTKLGGDALVFPADPPVSAHGGLGGFFCSTETDQETNAAISLGFMNWQD